MGRLFRAMNWVVVHPADAKAAFVTTDQPVCVLPPPGYEPNFYGFGFATPGADKIVPLSEKTCLVIRDLGTAFSHINADRAHVRRINLNITLHCQQFVIGPAEALVRNLVERTRVDSTARQPTMQVDGLGARKPRANAEGVISKGDAPPVTRDELRLCSLV
jgi:hypothetical protein